MGTVEPMTDGPYPPTDQPPLHALLQLARSGPDADWAVRMLCHLLERDAATRLPETREPFEAEAYDPERPH